MGGRIADVAVHPTRPSTWYVAVGSGGVWKTVNAGITWTPIFDDQPSFSIGCLAIDPNRPETIWVGTGEAVSGRHVAWGDGVYRSLDGGATWEAMGLDRSEHIGAILIDPRDGDVVHVAAEGPLWSSGGERGLFTTRDGGQNWEPSLTIDDDTGITSAVFAPDDPDTIHAAAYQRRRSVRSFVGGGPGSGIHTTSDGGATWTKVTEGLPKADLGKIGLAVTAADPSLVYATVEAAEESDRGFYRSTTRGRSWERRSGYISGGTGPHYYQEIFASPTDAEKVYQVDVFVHVTNDGGKNFRNMEPGSAKHSDNHVVWIDPTNGDHLLVGTDAGLYETYDDGGSWRHVSNLPVSQFYRVAVDNSVPFTNILGGAQDLGTLAGPSRTGHIDGVRNQDWWVPLGADGYHVAFDPDEPEISYMEWQVGNVVRHDRRTMELTDIQPQPAPGDDPERWNWDTPIVISPHASNRIYVASQRVWRSEDRGDSWTAISPDLTTGANRYELPTGGRVWSVDALYDHMAMSGYATITDVSESPVTDGVLYVGTDDGQIHIGEVDSTEDGGQNWRKAGEVPDLAAEAFVNDVEACRHRPDAAFLAADDHKNGDYSPKLYETEDRGRTWRSIRGDLPDGIIIWKIEQDHVNQDLLFVGAENGLYASLDRGDHWHRLGAGPTGGGKGASVPTISFRDLAIQRRDDDLIGATFGRGFYILDDYSPLRELSEATLAGAAALFPIRDAWRYVPYQPMQSPGQRTLGDTAWRAANPAFGATITYHLADDVRSAAKQRREDEKAIEADAGDVEFPGWDRLLEERVAGPPIVVLRILDDSGRPVRVLEAATEAGIHRTTWDLRAAPPDPVQLEKPDFVEPWVSPPQGPLLAAGRYQAELVRIEADGGEQVLAGPEGFDVVDTPAVVASGAASSSSRAEFAAVTADLSRRVSGATEQVTADRDRIRHLRAGLAATPGPAPELFARLDAASRRLEDVAAAISGDPVRGKLHEAADPSVRELVGRVQAFHWRSTADPTATQRASLDRAATGFEPLAEALTEIGVELAELASALDQAGGPWTRR